jgi:UDP-N-acetyl-2-amino-2-deoxyglucuronate dehydrogenase
VQKIRLAIVGCGVIASRHVVALQELRERGRDEVEVVAVCDLDEAAAERLAGEVEAKLGARPAVRTDYRQVLDRREADALDICLPHGLHHGVAVQAMEAGLHVLCEKPLGVTVRASRAMAEAADRTGKVLSTAVPYRRLIGQRTLRWLLNDSGIIGRPTTFVHQLIRARPAQSTGQATPPHMVWRRDRLMSGGGPAMDSGFHYCDSIRYLLGDVEKVYAELRELSSGQPRGLAEAREDTLFATFTFKSGVVGTWSWGTATAGLPLVNVVFYGSQGSVHDTSEPSPSIYHLFWRNPPRLVESGLVTRPDGSTIPLEQLEQQYLAGLADEEREAQFPGGTMDGFAIEIWDFVEAVRGRRARPEVDGWEGLRSLAVCHAIYESATSGQPVRVDDVAAGKVDAYQRPIDEHWGLAPVPAGAGATR